MPNIHILCQPRYPIGCRTVRLSQAQRVIRGKKDAGGKLHVAQRCGHPRMSSANASEVRVDVIVLTNLTSVLGNTGRRRFAAMSTAAGSCDAHSRERVQGIHD